MSRQRECELEEALDRAVLMFWERGYRGCSVQDLVEATGLQRSSLKESYGDKRGLFLAALKRYEHRYVSAVLAELESPGASVDEVDATLVRLRATLASSEIPHGCLLCNTVTEFGVEDPTVVAVVGGFVERLRAGFGRALGRAREEDRLAPGVDPTSHATFLAGVVLGACVHAKTAPGVPAAEVLIDAARRSLTA